MFLWFCFVAIVVGGAWRPSCMLKQANVLATNLPGNGAVLDEAESLQFEQLLAQTLCNGLKIRLVDLEYVSTLSKAMNMNVELWLFGAWR